MYIFTGSSITFQYSDKKPQMISDTHPKYNEIVRLVVEEKDLGAAYDLVDLKAVVEEAVLGSGIKLVGNSLFYKGDEVDGLLGQRIIEIHRLGLSVDSLIAFLDNLMANPSSRAVTELYGFLEVSRLPITDDGCFLAYKAVRMDYTDKHSGKISNKVGEVISMPRNKVSDNKDDTCSFGLHFAAHEYASDFGGSQSRMMIMKINPRDVVSIPSDYNNQKGRCCEYTVFEEVERADVGLVGAQVVDTAPTPAPVAPSVKTESFIENKGVMPVPYGTLVDVVYRCGKINYGVKAGVQARAGGSLSMVSAYSWTVTPAPYTILEWRPSQSQLTQDQKEEGAAMIAAARSPVYRPQVDNYDDRDVFDSDGEFWGNAKEFPVNRKTAYSLERYLDDDQDKDYGGGWFFTEYKVASDNLVFRRHNGADFDYVTVTDVGEWDIYARDIVLGS